MSFAPPEDYWLEIPAGKYRVGLTREEARRLAEQSASWFREHGVEQSLNMAKMLRQSAEVLDSTGNPDWVEQYLLAHYPAREIELPAFAIAKRPVTNGEYRQFMTETSETQKPASWERGEGNDRDDLPAQGLSWWQALAFMEWAGARVPFEDEWERAMRGPSHRLFPWGDEFMPLGEKILEENYASVLPLDLTRSSDGIEGGCQTAEWCADLWRDVPIVGSESWSPTIGEPWWRTLRGGQSPTPRSGGGVFQTIPATVCRMPERWGSYRYWHESAGLRLVRADGRRIPPPHAETPPYLLVMQSVRQFESRVLARVLEGLRDSHIATEHTITTRWVRPLHDDVAPGSKAVWRVIDRDIEPIRHGFPPEPNRWCNSETLVAASRETFRRVPKEHGVFLWHVQYRLTETGQIRVRHVSAFRMAFDKAIHRFENRFRDDEPDTALEDVTPEMLRRAALDAFQYYEIHADRGESPFRA